MYRTITRVCNKIKLNVPRLFCSNYIKELEDYSEEYENISNKCFLGTSQNVFLIHPYIKWGPKKLNININYEITEAKSLINTLNWNIIDSQSVPIDNIDKKTIFGTGNLQKLKHQIRQYNNITAIFINVGTLKNRQIFEFESIFGVQILDRYKIVMQILKFHAKKKHAKLQVSLAEIPYMRSKLKYLDFTNSENWKVKDKFLQDRQIKLKNELKKLRSQRELLRNRRRELNFPVVAVVGYTNVGKTALIKSLTGDKNLIPKNQLFATLDVTLHSGFLPCKLEILYVDTVGFIKNIPTDLIECFIATLEDAMLADVILHVQDLSNENLIPHKNHVQSVLQNLAEKTGQKNMENKIINVGNKIDCCQHTDQKDLILISAKYLTGIDELKQKIEKVVLKNTNRYKIVLKVPTGGDEMRWLFKNSTVIQQSVDENNSEFQVMEIIISEANLKKFNNYFVNK